MKDNTVSNKIIFWLEVGLVFVLPFVIWWGVTPTNVLNSSVQFKLLEKIGILGSGLILLAGIPVGIIGIIKAKRMTKLRKTTTVLSIINLSVGSIEVLTLAVIICATLLGAVSV